MIKIICMHRSKLFNRLDNYFFIFNINYAEYKIYIYIDEKFFCNKNTAYLIS